MKKLFYLNISTILLLSSCYYDKIDKLYGGNVVVCDTSNTRFGLHVQPIIKKNCTDVGCHVTANPSGSIKLENYNDIKLVVANDRLLNAIKQTYPTGNAKNMPPNKDKINICDIARIETWIANGAPNN